MRRPDPPLPCAAGSSATRDHFLWTHTKPDDGRPVRLHVVEWLSEARDALIMLHGGGAHAHWWDSVAPLFLSEFRVFALDLRGHGDSDHTPSHYAAEHLVADVAFVLEQLAPGADVVGASMGGQIALRAAAAGVAMRRLVLVDVPPRAPAKVVDRRSVFGTPKVYASREEALRRFRVVPSETRAPAPTLARIAEHSIRPLGDGRYGLKFDHRMFDAPAVEPPPDMLDHVRVPVLLLRGESSDILDAETACAMARRLADCRLVTIPAAGHHVFLDNRDAFVEAVKDYLRAKED